MTQLDTPMFNAPLTPIDSASPTSPQPQQPIVDFSPQTVPYDESFENSVMEVILNPPTHSINPPAHDGATNDPPIIPAAHLPIPLTSPLRTHPSPLPGLNLTHLNGYHTGGPGPSTPTIQAFAEKVAAEHGADVTDAEAMKKVARTLLDGKMGELKERMGRREDAVKRNKDVDEELEKLRLQRDAEVRVLERLKGKR